jgi:hypothetical protein
MGESMRIVGPDGERSPDVAVALTFEGRVYRVGVVRVTPARATEWLAKHGPNRTLQPKTMKRYARLMGLGEWVLNGEPIVFDSRDRLINGQHRLQAAIESGHAFTTFVVWGVDGDAIESMDKGRKRTTRDDLVIHGEVYTRTLAAAGAHYIRMDLGDVGSPITVESSDVRSLIDREPHIRESCITGLAANHLMPDAWAAALHHALWNRDPGKSDEFFKRLIDGAGLERGDPIFELREKLIKSRHAKGNPKAIREGFAITIKAFNHWRKGKKVTKSAMRLRPDEEFPEID